MSRTTCLPVVIFRSMASADLMLTTLEKRKALPCWPRKFCGLEDWVSQARGKGSLLCSRAGERDTRRIGCVLDLLCHRNSPDASCSSCSQRSWLSRGRRCTLGPYSLLHQLAFRGRVRSSSVSQALLQPPSKLSPSYWRGRRNRCGTSKTFSVLPRLYLEVR
jgi:hypothetical protein